MAGGSEQGVTGCPPGGDIQLRFPPRFREGPCRPPAERGRCSCCLAFCKVPGSHHPPRASVDVLCYLKANKRNTTKPSKPPHDGQAAAESSSARTVPARMGPFPAAVFEAAVPRKGCLPQNGVLPWKTGPLGTADLWGRMDVGQSTRRRWAAVGGTAAREAGLAHAKPSVLGMWFPEHLAQRPHGLFPAPAPLPQEGRLPLTSQGSPRELQPRCPLLRPASSGLSPPSHPLAPSLSTLQAWLLPSPLVPDPQEAVLPRKFWRLFSLSFTSQLGSRSNEHKRKGKR